MMPSHCRSFGLLTLFVLIVSGGFVMADEQERYAESVERHTERLDGAADPDSIPIWATMPILLDGLEAFSIELSGAGMSDVGLRVLREYRGRDIVDGRRDNAHGLEVWDRICADIDSIDAHQAVLMVDEAVQSYRQTRSQRYERLLGELSTRDQHIVSDFIRERVARNVRAIDMDATAVAAEAPEMYLDGIRQTCESHLAFRQAQRNGNVAHRITIKDHHDVEQGVTITEINEQYGVVEE
jgi:hypothetical protein